VTPFDSFVAQLKALGYAIDERHRDRGIAVILDFCVRTGRHAGKVIAVGLHGADFPMTPPAGIHINPPLAANGQNNVSESPLGNGWQYWSRRLTSWSTDRSSHHIISYINKVFHDA